MKADMHTHSRYSDGGFWPSQIMEQAYNKGLELVCISDHDTLGGSEEALYSAQKLGIQTWPAVEIDCQEESVGYNSEILAYFPKLSYSTTQKMLIETCRIRKEGVSIMLDKVSSFFNIKDLNIETIVKHRYENRPQSDSKIKQLLNEDQLRFSKTDVYLELKKYNVLPETMSYNAFKREYFEGGIFTNIAFPKPSIKTVVETVKKDGGVLVIPHIGHEFDDSYESINKNSDKLDTILNLFYAQGVRGAELYHYRNSDTEKINAFVKEHSQKAGFFNTYGSDTHGLGTHRADLGAFYGDFSDFPEIED